MDNLRFSSIAKRYATGISFTVRSKIAYRRSPRVRTPAAYFKAHSRPFATPFFRSPFMAWPNKSATALRENAPPGRFLIPQGGGKVRTPRSGSVPCGAPCCAGITDLQRGFWNNCEPSTGFVQFRRSVRQCDLLLRCSSARLVWVFLVFAFAFFYSGGALLDSRVRNHTSVQDRSSFGNSPFKSKFCCRGFGTSLLF